jgi:Notch-like protein
MLKRIYPYFLCYRELTPTLTKIINNSITQCVFPSDLKKAEVIPLYKKKDHLSKENYRPVSILPTFSKIFEHQLSVQLQNHFDKILHPKAVVSVRFYSMYLLMIYSSLLSIVYCVIMQMTTRYQHVTQIITFSCT